MGDQKEDLKKLEIDHKKIIENEHELKIKEIEKEHEINIEPIKLIDRKEELNKLKKIMLEQINQISINQQEPIAPNKIPIYNPRPQYVNPCFQPQTNDIPNMPFNPNSFVQQSYPNFNNFNMYPNQMNPQMNNYPFIPCPQIPNNYPNYYNQPIYPYQYNP